MATKGSQMLRDNFRAAFKEKQRQLKTHIPAPLEKNSAHGRASATQLEGARAAKASPNRRRSPTRRPGGQSQAAWRRKKDEAARGKGNCTLTRNALRDQRWINERRAVAAGASALEATALGGGASPREKKSETASSSTSSRSSLSELDFDYRERAERAAQLQMQLAAASKLLASADTAQWRAAAALYAHVITQDSSNVRARCGLNMARVRMKAVEKKAREEELSHKKMTLMKLRFGPEQWRDAIVMDQAITVSELRQVFKLLDTDGSGTLDRDEFETFVSYFDQDLTVSEVDEAMAALDADNSGTVDFGELCRWFKLPPPEI